MKRTVLFGLLIAGVLSLSATSCKKDNDPAPATPNPSTPTPTPKSRDVKYTLTGNYTGRPLEVTYYQPGGGIVTVPPAESLPWEKAITYEPSVQGISFQCSGNNGIPGQTVTAKIFAGGKEVKTATGTVGSNGIIVVNAGTHIF